MSAPTLRELAGKWESEAEQLREKIERSRPTWPEFPEQRAAVLDECAADARAALAAEERRAEKPVAWMRRAAHGPVFGPTAESVTTARDWEDFRKPTPLYLRPAPPASEGEPGDGEGYKTCSRGGCDRSMWIMPWETPKCRNPEHHAPPAPAGEPLAVVGSLTAEMDNRQSAAGEPLPSDGDGKWLADYPELAELAERWRVPPPRRPASTAAAPPELREEERFQRRGRRAERFCELVYGAHLRHDDEWHQRVGLLIHFQSKLEDGHLEAAAPPPEPEHAGDEVRYQPEGGYVWAECAKCSKPGPVDEDGHCWTCSQGAPPEPEAGGTEEGDVGVWGEDDRLGDEVRGMLAAEVATFVHGERPSLPPEQILHSWWCVAPEGGTNRKTLALLALAFDDLRRQTAAPPEGE